MKCCSGIYQIQSNKKVRAIRCYCMRPPETFEEYIDGNSNKHPLLAQLDKEIGDESDGEWDQESAGFHTNDEADHDSEISDRESIQK